MKSEKQVSPSVMLDTEEEVLDIEEDEYEEAAPPITYDILSYGADPEVESLVNRLEREVIFSFPRFSAVLFGQSRRPHGLSSLCSWDCRFLEFSWLRMTRIVSL